MVVEYYHQEILHSSVFSDIGTNSSRVLDSSRAYLDNKTVVEVCTVKCVENVKEVLL